MPAVGKKKNKADEKRKGSNEPSSGLVATTFRSGHQVEIRLEGADEGLVLRSASGECVLQIAMTELGPVLKLSGVALEIAADATLALRAGHLDVRAGSAQFEVAGDLDERVGGSVARTSEGKMVTTARDVDVVAHPGGVRIRANDDVDVQGERVRLNSEDPPMAQTWEEFERRRKEIGS